MDKDLSKNSRSVSSAPPPKNFCSKTEDLQPLCTAYLRSGRATVHNAGGGVLQGGMSTRMEMLKSRELVWQEYQRLKY